MSQTRQAVPAFLWTEVKRPMATTSLTINVDEEVAQAFESASSEEREKLELLLSLRLQEILAIPECSLREAMDELGREAESRGLTPEILDSILHER